VGVMICATCGENVIVRMKSGKVGVSCACSRVRAEERLATREREPWSWTLKCRVCQKRRPAVLFRKRTASGGRQRICHDCDTESAEQAPVARKAKARAYAEKNTDKLKDAALLRNYGITLAERDALLAAQEGKCAICQAALVGNRNLHVDHCHATGAIRGLLCRSCNTALGFLKDDTSRLKRAILYLRNGETVTAGRRLIWRLMPKLTAASEPPPEPRETMIGMAQELERRKRRANTLRRIEQLPGGSRTRSILLGAAT
jgi:hypothetical protein